MTPTASDRTVLLVEDDARVRQVMQWALEEQGIAVAVARDGQEAIEMARRQRPAVVLLDWTLPRASGEEVADALRECYGGAVPVVLITADGRSAEKARRIGAAAYFHKPFDVDEIVATASQLIAAG